jgi:hypothetical protein
VQALALLRPRAIWAGRKPDKFPGWTEGGGAPANACDGSKTRHVLPTELDDVSYSIRAIPYGTSNGRNAMGIPVAFCGGTDIDTSEIRRPIWACDLTSTGYPYSSGMARIRAY